MIEELVRYWNIALFLVPLGVIGVWRWSVWLIKKIGASFYRSPVGELKGGSLSVVTPVYNENPEVFEIALNSWNVNGHPSEIIAVIDYSDTKCIEVFKKFRENHANARLIVTRVPGKRQALADGIAASHSDFVALVDSDTIWADPIHDKLLAPFSDPRVGGVSPRQDVFAPNTLARKLFQINLFNRYFVEMPFLGAVGNALTCLSGRTAVYRRSAIVDKLDALINEKFMGQKSVSGDDKALTRLVQENGWKAKYIRDAVVYTPGFADVASLLRQLVRWSRNSWRSDLKTVFGGWVWRHNKILALHMIDRFFQPFTLLLGPIYFVLSIYFGYWKFAAILALWWLISRSIKIFGHLKKHPLDIFIMPQYVVFTYVSAVIKMYALFTVYQQGWITRWNESRIKKMSFVGKTFAYALSLLLMIGYIGAVSFYHSKVIVERQEKGSSVKIKKAVASIISQDVRLVSAEALDAKKQSILNYKAANASGHYVIKPGDTLLGLQKKFNLSSVSSIQYEGNVPIINPNSISVGAKVMMPVSDMKNVLNADNLLNGPARFVPTIITYDQTSNTIITKGGGGVVTLTKIKQALGPNSTALQQTSPGEWILRANLYIGKNVTLVLDKRDVTYLKLKSDAKGFVWLRSQNGNILISNTKITSWDETAGAPDTTVADGRSYVTAKGSGRMDVVNSDIGFLGYVGYTEKDAVKKRGGLFGGSYGLSWKITSGKLNDNLLTGSVVDSKIHDNYFGIYSFGATALLIKDNDVFHNINYGIDPHDDSNNLVITGNQTHDNGNHGIILSKRCINNEITGNVSYDNKLHGIMLDKNSNNNIVTGNTVYGNVDGIAVDTSSNYNLIANNTSHDNKQGIRLNSGATNNYIEANNFVSNATGMHVYGGATGNIALSNNVSGNKLGLSVQSAAGNVFYANFKPLDNAKDGNIKTGSDQNEIKL